MLAESYGHTIGIAVCVLLSGLFSGSETALTSLHHGRLQQLIAESRPGTRLLRLWRDRPVTVLSFLLVANNLVNILASALATELSLRVVARLGLGGGTGLAIALSVGIMTFLILVFGEVVPKTFARHNARLVVPLLPVLLTFYYLLWPVANLLARMGKRFIILAGGDPQSPQPTVTEEELEYLIQKGTTEGSLDSEKEKILSGAFDLEDTIVKEIMIPRTDIAMLEARDPLAKVMSTLAQYKFSRYPVYQESQDKVIGFFYSKDLFAHFQTLEKERKPFRLRDFTRPSYYVPETKPIDSLLREFQAERVHIAVVVDEYGGTAGLVTLEDVIEELVGEIYDEYDEEEKLYTRIDESNFVLNAKLAVEDLTDELELPVAFPEDRDYETVGGLVMDLAESVPEVGESFTYDGPHVDAESKEEAPLLRFEVMESDGVKLGQIRLSVLPREVDEPDD